MWFKRMICLLSLVGLLAASTGCYYQRTDKQTGKTQTISAEEFEQLNR